jgi:hypothetical protein
MVNCNPTDVKRKRSEVDIHPLETAEFRKWHSNASEQEHKGFEMAWTFVQNRTISEIVRTSGVFFRFPL